MMGREMERRGWAPEMAVVSPALRTRQTWDLVSAELSRMPDVTFDRTIYEAEAAAIAASIRLVPGRVSTLLVVGHNPGLADLAAMLASPASDPFLRAHMAEKFPTGALACFLHRGSWADLGTGSALLDAFLTPRDLG